MRKLYTEEVHWTWEWSAPYAACLVFRQNILVKSVPHESQFSADWPAKVIQGVRAEVCANRPLADDETRETGGWRIGKMSVTSDCRLHIDFGAETCEYDRGELDGKRLAFFDRHGWAVERGGDRVFVISPGGDRSWVFDGTWRGAGAGNIPPHIVDMALRLRKEALAEKASQVQLKPCPFCGGESAKFDDSSGANEVACGDCHAYSWGETPEKAVNAWNQRFVPVQEEM